MSVEFVCIQSVELVKVIIWEYDLFGLVDYVD